MGRSSLSAMPRSSSTRPRRRPSADRHAYLNASKRPLQILAFLLPLIIIYEAALVLMLRSDQGTITTKAHETLLNFFAAFGIPVQGSLFIGGVVIIVVLLLWHILTRDSWDIDLAAAGFMGLESIALAFPLLVIGQILRQLFHGGEAAPAAVMLGQAATPLANLNLASEWALSVGAGLYEELMFRMLLIAVIHTLLVDVAKASDRLGAGIAVAVSAAAFALYHNPAGSEPAVFYFIAGLYFGAVYVVRGFGIVVGTHAVYDVITFTLRAVGPHA